MALIHVASGFTNKIMHNSVFKIFIAFATVLLTFTGCIGDKNVTSSAGDDLSDVRKYVKVYTGDTDDDHFMFYYDLYNKSGTLVKHECTNMQEPKAEMASPDIVKVSVQSGTGASTKWTYYYDLSKNIFSPVYYYVLAEKGDTVVYFDGQQIVVTSMFDEKKLLKRVTLKNELAKCESPIETVAFIGDENKISVTYFSGESYKTITEIIDL